ncbi:unnamed protein product [Arctogadus glacialis]
MEGLKCSSRAALCHLRTSVRALGLTEQKKVTGDRADKTNEGPLADPQGSSDDHTVRHLPLMALSIRPGCDSHAFGSWPRHRDRALGERGERRRADRASPWLPSYNLPGSPTNLVHCR